jgi:hypothetical protein
MKSHRTIIVIGGLLVALAAALPAPVLASSLLSGYGGPGQGNQAILGSALVNGGRGGGSGGASGGSSSTNAGDGEASSAANGTGTSPSSSGSGASGGGKSGTASAPKGRREGGRRGTGKSGEEGTPAADRSAASFYPASERVPAGEGSGVLGLSGADLIYIILAVGVLAFMGVVTARLAGTTRRHGIGG